jgi:hypothetical protein
MRTRSRTGSLPARAARFSPTWDRANASIQGSHSQQSIPLLDVLAMVPALQQALLREAGDSQEATFEVTMAIVSLDHLQRLHTGGALRSVIADLWKQLGAALPPVGDWRVRLEHAPPDPEDQLKTYEVRHFCRAVGLKRLPTSRAAMLVSLVGLQPTDHACNFLVSKAGVFTRPLADG